LTAPDPGISPDVPDAFLRDVVWGCVMAIPMHLNRNFDQYLCATKEQFEAELRRREEERCRKSG
jgi:hypothetical protein